MNKRVNDKSVLPFRLVQTASTCNGMTEKKVQTVLGPVDPSKLGITFTHEHLSLRVDHVFYQPPPIHKAHMADCPIDPQNKLWITENL
ncbi:hypothetical protein CHUAL_006198 [Chamberlinius hualienensis]